MPGNDPPFSADPASPQAAELNRQADLARDAMVVRLHELRRRASARYMLGSTASAALPAASLAAKAIIPAAARVAGRHPGAVALMTAGTALAAFGGREDYAAVAGRVKASAGKLVAGTETALRKGVDSVADAGIGIFDRATSALGLGEENGSDRAIRGDGTLYASRFGAHHPVNCGSGYPATVPVKGKSHGSRLPSPGPGVAAAVAFGVALAAGLAVSSRR